MRLTVFWERMRAQFGESYAQSVAKDYVLAGLGGRTVEQGPAGGGGAEAGWGGGAVGVECGGDGAADAPRGCVGAA